MNKNALRSEMAFFGDTNKSLAKYLGISPSRFSAKVNNYNGAEFTRNEIDKIKQRYNLSADKVCVIFFAH